MSAVNVIVIKIGLCTLLLLIGVPHSESGICVLQLLDEQVLQQSRLL